LALWGIAEAMAEAGQFDRALQVAQKIEDAWDRSLALRESPKRWRKTRGNLTLPSKSAQKIEDAWIVLGRSAEIAEAMAKAGQFDLALQAAQKIEDASVRSWALRDIAEAMAEAG
jgi:hypothetical protein